MVFIFLKHVEDALTVLLVGHVLALEETVVFAGLILASVPKGHAEGVQALPERPGVTGDEEADLVFGLDLDVQAGNPLANARLRLEHAEKRKPVV
jgi:hypothetical protein